MGPLPQEKFDALSSYHKNSIESFSISTHGEDHPAVEADTIRKVWKD